MPKLNSSICNTRWLSYGTGSQYIQATGFPGFALVSLSTYSDTFELNSAMTSWLPKPVYAHMLLDTEVAAHSQAYYNLQCSCRYYTMHNGMIYTKYTLYFSSGQSTTEIWRVLLPLDTTSVKEIINNNEKWSTTPITGGKQMLRLFLSYTYVHAIHRREWRRWSGHSNVEGEAGYQQSLT